jgi:hypothetical protein
MTTFTIDISKLGEEETCRLSEHLERNELTWTLVDEVLYIPCRTIEQMRRLHGCCLIAGFSSRDCAQLAEQIKREELKHEPIRYKIEQQIPECCPGAGTWTMVEAGYTLDEAKARISVLRDNFLGFEFRFNRIG